MLPEARTKFPRNCSPIRRSLVKVPPLSPITLDHGIKHKLSFFFFLLPLSSSSFRSMPISIGCRQGRRFFFFHILHSIYIFSIPFSYIEPSRRLDDRMRIRSWRRDPVIAAAAIPASYRKTSTCRDLNIIYENKLLRWF